MDSQPAMFEIASGSSSSDSIVNISRSGASSISALASTDISTTVEKSEIDRLREENRLLEGRIRGYRTLSELLVESRRENEQLKCVMNSLLAQQKAAIPGGGTRLSASNPFSLVSLETAQQQSDKAQSQPDLDKLSLQDQGPKSTPPTTTKPATTSTRNLTSLDSPVLNPPVVGPPSSLQETVGPPADHEETKLVSLTTPAGADAKPASTPPESMPKQGTLHSTDSISEAENHSLDNQTASLADNKAGHQGSLPNGNDSSPELLQLDSDKYDEATYEKVGPQLGLGLTGLTSSMYAAGSDRAESRHIDFPSLASERSNDMAQPASHSGHGSLFNPPFMAMMHQSLSGSTANNQNSGLAAEVENITERLSSEPGDSSTAIAFQMHQIAERISRQEQKTQQQKKLVDALMRENQGLKRQVKMADNSHLAEIVTLREENTRLMQRLKGQHRDEETTVIKSQGSNGDWVHVEHSLGMGDIRTGYDKSLVDRVRKLEQEKAELQRANSNWKSQWDKMEQKHQIALNELRSKLVMDEQEISNLKSRLAEQSSEFESRMLEMKRQITEEENLKEEALHQQRLAERRCSELQNQLTEMRTQLSDTARDKQALSAELNIFKNCYITGQEMQRSRSSMNPASQTALEAEIAMLKEQLKVFAEDFEHEREDCTMAESARDAAKKEVESLARQNHSLSSQIKHLQKQIKDRDDTISWTLRQNEVLQREASEYKKKLAAEWKEKQGFKHMLALRQQQQQTQASRNPYLMQNTQPVYNPGSLYQPPLPLPNTTRSAPYLGGQGTPQPLNRATVAAMSPEHLPGAWTCSACTYINFPGRTVCESCGLVNSPRSHPDHFGFTSQQDTMYGSSEHAFLMSRGGERMQAGAGPAAGDLVVDSGAVSEPLHI